MNKDDQVRYENLEMQNEPKRFNLSSYLGKRDRRKSNGVCQECSNYSPFLCFFFFSSIHLEQRLKMHAIASLLFRFSFLFALIVRSMMRCKRKIDTIDQRKKKKKDKSYSRRWRRRFPFVLCCRLKFFN